MQTAPTSNPIAAIQAALQSGRLTLNSLGSEGGVALDVERENFLTLNATATAILEALSAGATDANTIADCVCDRFDVDQDVAHKCVDDFLQHLSEYLVARR